MALAALDHVTIHTTRLGVLTDFYARVLGLRPGNRPPFKFTGAWLYCGDRPTLHLVELPAAHNHPAPAAQDGQAQHGTAQDGPTRTPKIEHFAFRAEGLAEFLAQLRDFDVAYRTAIVPEFEIRQVHIRDPDGNHVEIAFAPEEEAELGDYPSS
jgi:catechol 2,3-dioxygenase-like lactoylglutathione lyase family enzyme